MKTVLFALFFWLTIPVFAQNTDSAYVRDNYVKTEKYIEMRDGVKLFTAIYTPKDNSKKYPIMLSRTPYTVSPYGQEKYKTSLGPTMQFAREGYIFVYQDVRGRWMSEGEFEDVRPHNPNKKSKLMKAAIPTTPLTGWLNTCLQTMEGWEFMALLIPASILQPHYQMPILL